MRKCSRRFNSSVLTLNASTENRLRDLVTGPFSALLGVSGSQPLKRRNDCCLIYSMILQEYLYRLKIPMQLVQSRLVTDEEALDHCFLVQQTLSANGDCVVIDPTAGQFFSSYLDGHRPIHTLIFGINKAHVSTALSQSMLTTPDSSLCVSAYYDSLLEKIDVSSQAKDLLSREYVSMLKKSRVMGSEEIISSLYRCLPESDASKIIRLLSNLHDKKEVKSEGCLSF